MRVSVALIALALLPTLPVASAAAAPSCPSGSAQFGGATTPATAVASFYIGPGNEVWEETNGVDGLQKEKARCIGPGTYATLYEADRFVGRAAAPSDAPCPVTPFGVVCVI